MSDVLKERLTATADLMGFASGRSVANWVPLTQTTAHALVHEGRGVTYQPFDDSRLSADEVYQLVLGDHGGLDGAYVEDQWPNVKADLYTTWSLSALAAYRTVLYARAYEMVACKAKAAAKEARDRVAQGDRLRDDLVTEAWSEER